MEIRKLNMLRGIAALIVVVSHYSTETNLLSGMLGNGGGHFGVMLFFILSGFLMSYLYMNRPADKVNFMGFVSARVARVLPLFFFVVLASYVLIAFGIHGVLYAISDRTSLLSHLLMLSGESVLWTIPAEIQFYILFVFLWWLYSRKTGYVYVLMSIISASFFLLRFPVPSGKVFGLNFDVLLIRSLPYFLIGVLFGLMYGNFKPPRFLRRNIFILSLVVIPLMYPKIFHFLTGHYHGMWYDFRVFLTVSAVYFALVFLVPDSNILLSNPLGDYLGKISYSLYLLHPPILVHLTAPGKKEPMIFLFVFVAVSVAVASISYLVIEYPARRLIRSIASPQPRPLISPEPSGTDEFVCLPSSPSTSDR